MMTDLTIEYHKTPDGVTHEPVQVRVNTADWPTKAGSIAEIGGGLCGYGGPVPLPHKDTDEPSERTRWFSFDNGRYVVCVRG